MLTVSFKVYVNHGETLVLGEEDINECETIKISSLDELLKGLQCLYGTMAMIDIRIWNEDMSD